MIAATLNVRRSGLRRVNLQTDLGAIADLIELCFRDEMDSGGRATVRDLRAMSNVGPFLPLMTLTDALLRGIKQSLVWEEAGQIVGNITLYPVNHPRDLERVTAIANVAVHPDYRRRGIARQLVEAALDVIQNKGHTGVILQVNADNLGAQRLYQQFGFHAERTWHHWRRPGSLNPPAQLPDDEIASRPPNSWQEEYALAERVFPAERGGLGWQRPLHPREFRRLPWRHLADFLSGSGIERWIVRDSDRELAGALWMTGGFARPTSRLTLLVHPDRQGQLEMPLLNYALRRLGSYRAVACEHPVDHEAATTAFERYEFRKRRTLTYMRWTAP